MIWSRLNKILLITGSFILCLSLLNFFNFSWDNHSVQWKLDVISPNVFENLSENPTLTLITASFLRTSLHPIITEEKVR